MKFDWAFSVISDTTVWDIRISNIPSPLYMQSFFALCAEGPASYLVVTDFLSRTAERPAGLYFPRGLLQILYENAGRGPQWSHGRFLSCLMQSINQQSTYNSTDYNLIQCFPNPFARGSLLVSKNNHGTSHPCSRKYRMSGR